jgi:hypothetical protein
MRIDLSRVLSQYFFNFYPKALYVRIVGRAELPPQDDRSPYAFSSKQTHPLMQRLIPGLITGDEQLDRDQHDNDDLQPQRPARVDDVGEHLSGVRDHR